MALPRADVIEAEKRLLTQYLILDQELQLSEAAIKRLQSENKAHRQKYPHLFKLGGSPKSKLEHRVALSHKKNLLQLQQL